MRLWLFLGALNGMIAVGAGAYGWHGMGGDEGAREMFAISVQYQMMHALGLLAVAWLADRRGRAPSVTVAGIAFTAGIVLFSGSLYAFALTGAVPVEGAAPAGGFAFVVGWLALMWTAVVTLRGPG